MRLQANMGDIYSEMGNYDEALLVLQAALKNGQRVRDQQMVLSVLNGLGDTFQKLKRWPQARAYYQRGLALSQHLGDTMGEVGIEIGLAESYSACNVTGPKHWHWPTGYGLSSWCRPRTTTTAFRSLS